MDLKFGIIMGYNSYFSNKTILGKNAIFNYVLSDRSDGKTFDSKVSFLEGFKTNKNIGIYCRRFKTEFTKTLTENFFDDVLGDKLPEKQKYRDLYGKWKFKGSKRGVMVSTDGGEHWDWIVFFVPLTVSGKIKSNLDPFVQRIQLLVFDEYIPLDDRYAPNEMTLLLELWKSIDRDRDKLQLLILGNKITPYSPFMDYFGLNLSLVSGKLRTYRNGTLAVQIYVSNEHRKKRSKGRFNDLVSGTEYDDYNSGGVLNVLNLKVASHIGTHYVYSFMTSKGEGSVWSNGRQYIISSLKRKDGIVIVDQMYNTGREEYMINFGKFGQTFKRLYKTGQLYFEDESTYHIFEDILMKVWR